MRALFIFAILFGSFAGQLSAHPSSLKKSSSLAVAGDTTLFQLGVGLMLTGNYSEADQCFQHLLSQDTQSVALLTNIGINNLMHGLSLLDEEEAKEVIKYVFPFEVAPGLGEKGGDTEEAQRKNAIETRFTLAQTSFSQSIGLDTTRASSYLNHASSLILLGRWKADKQFLQQGYRALQLAEQLARAQQRAQTLGYCYLLKGILYDYLDKPDKRDEYFELALRQHAVAPDDRLQSLILRNQEVAAGQEAVFQVKDGETFNIMEDESEMLEKISLGKLMQAQFSPDQTLLELEGATLYRKGYSYSDVFLFYRNPQEYFLFHQTRKEYPATTGKGIKLGDQELYLREAYGRPVQAHGTSQGGRFLYYRKAKLIFLIGGDGAVRSWMVWRGKR